ncbi:FtsK/SpoIIIE domain-containing protein [Clostridium botulinum]
MTESTHEVIFKYKSFNSKGEIIKEFDESKQTKSQNKSNKLVLKDTYKKAFKNIFNTNKTSEISNSKTNKSNNEQSNPQDNLFWKLSYEKEDKKSDKDITHNIKYKENKSKKQIELENKIKNQDTSKNRFQGYNKKIKEDIILAQKRTEFLNNWEKAMTYTGLFNKMHQTFSPNDLKFTSYGAEARLYIPWGYNYKHLSSVRETLQNNLKCTVVLKTYANKNYIDGKFIYIENCNKIKFKPVPIAKPYELFLGVDESGNPILVDINSEPHILIAGSTRSGKNGTLDHVITNLIHNNTEDEVSLYLLQGAKGDLAKYRNCKQVSEFAFCDDMDTILKIIESIDKEMNKRKELFMSMIDNFEDPNLKDYNKKHPENKLPYIYVIVDEIMTVAANAIKDKKSFYKDIIDLLEKLAQFGGAYGITYVISHQKPQKLLLSSFLKNMSNVRVCYGFNDSVCSTIVLGEGRYEAVGLPPRKAYVICKAYEGYLYTLDLTDSIYKYVKESIVETPETDKKSDSDSNDKNDSNTKFNDQNKKDAINAGIKQLQEQNQKMKSLKTIDKPSENNTKVNIKKQSNSVKSPYIKNDFSKVHPKTKEELLEENLSKIEGYVPYIPPKPRE